MQTSKAKTTTLTIRIPVELKKQLEEAAQREDRTVTQSVCRAVRLWLAQPDAMKGLRTLGALLPGPRERK